MHPGSIPLAGFYETTLTEAGAPIRCSASLPRTFEALNANAYEFTCPTGAVDAGAGPVPQAFRAGERAWGVQFHPEVRRDQVLEWFREEPSRRARSRSSPRSSTRSCRRGRSSAGGSPRVPPGGPLS